MTRASGGARLAHRPGDAAPAAASPAPGPAARPDWRTRFDFDGDGEPDRVRESFTGGAHCCYRLSVELSSGGRHDLPFQLDGGYVVFDLSQPEAFDIRDQDGDGLPELVMTIETYNGEEVPMPAAWTRTYGIRSHRVAVGFAGGRVRVRDQRPGGRGGRADR